MINRVYMYLDEAGNFDFSPSGSKYFIMTCAVTRKPFEHVAPLYEVKCDCLSNGIDLKNHKEAHKFHASEDAQAVRDAVFSVIENCLQSFSVYSVIIRKNKTNPSIRDFAALYGKVFGWLINYIFERELNKEINEVIIITDVLPVQRKQSAVRAALKKFLNKCAGHLNIAYRLYHHRSESDISLQVADYCCWAIQRKWERDDMRSYNIIASRICGEGDLFESGKTEYYSYEEN